MEHTVEIRIDRELPSELLADVQMKVCYVSEAIVGQKVQPQAGGGCLISLRLSEPDEQLESKVLELVEQMARNFKPIETEILWESPCRATCDKSAYETLTAEGEIKREAEGLYALGPRATACMHLLRDDIRRMAAEFDAEEHTFPDLVSTEVLNKSKYFDAFPHYLSFASRPLRDADKIRSLQASAPEFRDGVGEAVAPPQFVLQPAVCFHCYTFQEHSELADPKTMTCEGRCYRYEGTRFEGLRRLYGFTMREIVFLGPSDFVFARRQKSIDLAKLLIERWGLAGRIEAATDSFFIDAYPEKRFYQLATRGKYEFQADLPHEGGSVAALSFNIHGDFFGRAFDIKSGGQLATTGCTAFGLERWIYAFFAQHGTRPEGWPAAIREDLERGAGRKN